MNALIAVLSCKNSLTPAHSRARGIHAHKQKGAQIALDYLGSSEALREVGERWGLSREMVRVYVARWKGLAQDHFALNGIRRAV